MAILLIFMLPQKLHSFFAWAKAPKSLWIRKEWERGHDLYSALSLCPGLQLLWSHGPLCRWSRRALQGVILSGQHHASPHRADSCHCQTRWGPEGPCWYNHLQVRTKGLQIGGYETHAGKIHHSSGVSHQPIRIIFLGKRVGRALRLTCKFF